MLPIILILFLNEFVTGQPCEDVFSVDVTNGKRLKNGSVEKDGVVFPQKYVYSKFYSNGTLRKFGCLCEFKTCFRKCCPVGSVMLGKNCTQLEDLDVIGSSGLELYNGSQFREKKTLEQTGFGVLIGRPYHQCYLEDLFLYIQQNGHLNVFVDDTPQDYGPDKYCIDNFVSSPNSNTTELKALICFRSKDETHSYPLSSTCMLISCFFIILTVAVYAWLPELRNLHGMVLMAYLLSFLVGFTFTATMQLLMIISNIDSTTCVVFSFIMYFSLLAAFFWLNVMCYDIWATFGGKRSTSSRRSEASVFFKTYSIYAFGVPAFLTILLAILEFGVDPEISPYLPRLRKQGCFLYKNSKLIYFYGPIVILCISNLIFFTLTAINLAEIKKQTKVLNRKDQQRFVLYIKLFIVMGVNWLLEVVSSLYATEHYIWKFTDAYNVLIGLIIFIIFVCKKNTLKMIRKRYRHLIGKPLSRTQTTSTSLSTRTCSQSKDELQLNSVNKT
ncbi:putative G-protein coupled receptor Mth-like 3 [Anticarsia gemmatalis]|uniref:putative G-protein coupled receptor Mth-like 3 n=1 Tax=Anticarsia gemmatalis TaxID=129554 RepID=UPI003F75F034